MFWFSLSYLIRCIQIKMLKIFVYTIETFFNLYSYIHYTYLILKICGIINLKIYVSFDFCHFNITHT